MKLAYLLSLLLSAALPSTSGASALRTCQQTKKNSVDGCTAAKDGAREQSNRAVEDAKASVANNQAVNNKGDKLSNVGKITSAAALNAKGACEEKKKKCDSDCDPAKGNDKEKSLMSQEKQKCAEEIKKITDALSGSAAESADGSEKSDETKKESQGGGMPQMPGGGGDKSDDKKDDAPAASPAATPSPSPAPAPTPANESKAQGFQDPCDGDQANSAACKKSTGSGAACPANMAMTVCTLAQSFCGGGNTDQCPSCRALKSQNPLPANVVTQDCSLDPGGAIGATSPVIGTNATGGGSLGAANAAGSGGGGSGSVLGTAASLTDRAQTGAAPESDERKLLQSMNTQSPGGGGGGGSGGGGEGSAASSNDVSDFLAGYGLSTGRTPAKTKSTTAVESDLNPRVTDVARTSVGFDVLEIQSLVIRARCDADKALNCPPHN